MNPRFNLRPGDHLATSEGKKLFNKKHFAESASRYDFATRALSLGQDAGWKKKLVAALPEESAPVCIDIACGTGDVTFLLADRYGEGEFIGIDLTQEMIDIANQRNQSELVRFECADMCQLPVEDNSVDILTGSYAIRNAPDLTAALAEFRRVVKGGGTLAFLDFSKEETPLKQAFQYRLLRFWGGLWGLLLHGNIEVHGYISKSLQSFPTPPALEEAFCSAGFAIGESRALFGGMMRLHVLRA